MSKKIISRINIFAPLCIGCLIYFFFKQDPVLRKLENTVPLFGLLRNMFFIEFHSQSKLGSFLMNHLCDFLWAYSLSWSAILSQRSICKGCVIALVACALNEFIQLTPYVCATFDWLDLLYEFLAIILASVLFYFHDTR